MNLKFAKLLLILCVAVFIGAGLFLALRHLSFFNIKDVEVHVSGAVETLNADINRCIAPYKGLNIFTANTSYLESVLKSFEGVESVKTKRYYPSKLIVSITFAPYCARVYVNDGSKVDYYMASRNGLEEVSEETYILFSRLPQLSLDSKYADYIGKWGADNGFIQMCALCEALDAKSLIRGLKYYNNSSEDFGVLEMDLTDVNAVLDVKEAVTGARLLEAIDIIVNGSKSDTSKKTVNYNLYASALIKKN